MPDWDRYGIGGEHPYVRGSKWDPFDKNKWKGDVPIIGQQTFLNFTGTSDSFLDGRRLPTPTDVSSARPGSPGFFGRGDQIFFDQTFAFSFDLFHGDTSFRPIDWRIRITPVVSLNYLDVQERGRRQRGREQRHHAPGFAPRLAGSIRRSQTARHRAEFRFHLCTCGHSGFQ